MAYLRIFQGDTLLEQRKLDAERTTIGRSADNDIVLRHHAVSKLHATIQREGVFNVLVDNDSANGVFVGGRRVQRHTLKYWDEIQIHGFVLKFMAVPRLKGEEAGTSELSTAPLSQEATMEVDISSLGDLAKLRKRIRVPAVSVLDDAGNLKNYNLDKVNFRIGRSADCDLRTAGWLSPRVAACIQRRNDGCYLLPGWRGRVSVNGQRIVKPVILRDHDDLQVRGLTLRFCRLPVDPV